MDLMIELLGNYSGALSLIVILLSALGIPAGVLWALMRQVKGPMELAHEPQAPAHEKHSAWRDQRYVH